MSQAPHFGPVLSQIGATGAPGIPGAVPTALDKNLNVAVDKIGADNLATGLTITNTPKGYASVVVDRAVYLIGDGVKTLDCYFSVDGGTTARALVAVVGGDQLIWNALIAGKDLIAPDPLGTPPVVGTSISLFYGV